MSRTSSRQGLDRMTSRSGSLSTALNPDDFNPVRSSLQPLQVDANGAASPPSDHGHVADPSHHAPAREVTIHTEPVLEAKTIWQKFCALFETPEVATNEIKTSKYTFITFLPVNLYEQFTRVANLYFLIIAALQLIPGLAPTSWFTTVCPLAFVLIFNAGKEIYDDYHRHISDNEVNSRQVLVLREGGREVSTAWRDVVVGDLVKVTQDQEVPVDLLLLSSSDPGGLCYVETANLDGETNLKTKFSFKTTAGMRVADEFVSFVHRFKVRCEAPNARLYVFDGAMLNNDDPSEQLPLTADNLLLRGCTLKKTDWVIGAAIFTGSDTKIMMNRTPSARKITQLERHMNILVLALFIFVIVVSCFLGGGNQIWMRLHSGEWYLNYTDEWPDLGPGFAGWIIQVIRFMILFNGFIPISLYVTLELVKVLQCMWVLNSDLKMYHKEDDAPFQCHTTSLNEDLGQVQYVLSDKTGTLTQNIMGFVWASIGGEMFGRTEGPQAAGPLPPHVPANTPHTLVMDRNLTGLLGSYWEELVGSRTRSRSNGGEAGRREPRADVAQFLLSLAVCNTVVPGVAEDGTIVYQASSPDEEALVQGAAYLGYKLINRTNDTVEVAYHGKHHLFQVLAVLEFNSDRKRMSIICKCPDGRIRLFCKGADTMVMGRVHQGRAAVPAIRTHLGEMAQTGYRTLCVAERELSEQQFKQWHDQFKAASVSLRDREGQMARVSERIEVDMELLGCTAVEDKLQEGVPEAIESLIQAGIKVWVLTGDKVETAINIALACRLFNQDMSIVELRERDLEGAKDPSMEGLVLQRKLEEVEMENQAMMLPEGETNVGLVVEGGALAAMLHPQHQNDFVRLCSSAKSVVCCRVSPMQKANVTKLVKKKMHGITLGIGDGANDVGMITAAHIGCGISGREGRAAVLASDFSFAQFRYLSRLLLVHGRSSYKRNCEVVQYSFYKNWVFNFTMIIYAFASAYSAQPLYTSGLIATLNVFWSSYVIVGYSILEQDVSPSTVMQHPQLYKETMSATIRSFMMNQFWYFMEGTWHALVIYFVIMYSMEFPDSTGVGRNWVEIGCTMYMAIVITINLKLAMKTRYWTWYSHLMTWLSITTLFLFYYLYGLVFIVYPIEGAANMANIAPQLYASPPFWLSGVLLAPVMSLVLDYSRDVFQRLIRPKPYQIFQEIEQRAELKDVAVQELGLEFRPAMNN